ncbi:MAG TPA: TIGR03557 family F420-dependent LLM class oxidoreductase [Sporichthyaceae bacterium]|jgi:G6PDH family F420-dependent oxidoreductase
MKFGYTLMCEQAGPAQLVRDAVAAEQAGYDFAVISDHYFPWLEEQGHAPFAWSVLGAVAQATDRLPLMTFVTCPTRRYHPALVAQMSATMALLAPGRFALGLGAGENLNEHVVGGEWPAVDERHDMLEEAAGIIRALWTGDEITWRGMHFDVVKARVFDVPKTPPPLGIAVSGPSSCRIAGEHADVMIAVEPNEALCDAYDAAGGAGKPRYGQQPMSYDVDRQAAITRAHEQFRWFGAGWSVNAELPGPAAFDAASQFVRPEDVAAAMPCGDDVEAVIKSVQPWANAGFTRLALLQIGERAQDGYLEWSARELLPALRAAFPE